MKRIIFFLLLISPVFVFAQDSSSFVASRYCPDPSQIFKGSIYHTDDGKPWIEVTVDPDFEKKTLRAERHITGDIPLTPVYDLVVRIKPEFNYYCIPDWAGNAAPVTAEQLPKEVSVGASLNVGVKNEIMLNANTFQRTAAQDDQGRFVYEWKLSGWSAGIGASGGHGERLVSAIQHGEPVSVLIITAKPDGTVIEQSKTPLSFSLCAPLSGGSPHKIVYMRSTSSQVQASQMVPTGDAIRMAGFEEIQPFKKYSLRNESPTGVSYFAHFADLALHDDTNWTTFFGTFFIGANSRPRRISSCGSDGSQYFFPTARITSTKLAAYAPYLNHIAFFNTHLNLPIEVAMHEMGHSFAGLEDEYHSGYDLTLYHANCGPAETRSGLPQTDTFKNLLKKVDTAPRNADLTVFKRAYWDPFGDTIKGCSTNVQFRPSIRSIMNSGDFESERFNVPSCVWLLKAIKGISSAADWQECMTLDGLEKPTVRTSISISTLFSPFVSSWFAHTFAAVGALSDDAQSQSDLDRFVNVETFSTDGKEIESRIFENTGNEDNPSWQEVAGETDSVTKVTPLPAAPSTPPPSPSSNITDISDDSVFDTVSVDLKVNGQDGPITVGKRDRIVLSWISEGATRCRGVWSKNDIKLSGTASGRITKPVTIKIACINADGERADDEVRVDVTD